MNTNEFFNKYLSLWKEETSAIFENADNIYTLEYFEEAAGGKPSLARRLVDQVKKIFDSTRDAIQKLIDKISGKKAPKKLPDEISSKKIKLEKQCKFNKKILDRIAKAKTMEELEAIQKDIKKGALIKTTAVTVSAAALISGAIALHNKRKSETKAIEGDIQKLIASTSDAVVGAHQPVKIGGSDLSSNGGSFKPIQIKNVTGDGSAEDLSAMRSALKEMEARAKAAEAELRKSGQLNQEQKDQINALNSRISHLKQTIKTIHPDAGGKAASSTETTTGSSKTTKSKENKATTSSVKNELVVAGKQLTKVERLTTAPNVKSVQISRKKQELALNCASEITKHEVAAAQEITTKHSEVFNLANVSAKDAGLDESNDFDRAVRKSNPLGVGKEPARLGYTGKVKIGRGEKGFRRRDHMQIKNAIRREGLRAGIPESDIKKACDIVTRSGNNFFQIKNAIKSIGLVPLEESAESFEIAGLMIFLEDVTDPDSTMCAYTEATDEEEYMESAGSKVGIYYDIFGESGDLEDDLNKTDLFFNFEESFNDEEELQNAISFFEETEEDSSPDFKESSDDEELEDFSEGVEEDDELDRLIASL